MSLRSGGCTPTCVVKPVKLLKRASTGSLCSGFGNPCCVFWPISLFVSSFLLQSLRQQLRCLSMMTVFSSRLCARLSFLEQGRWHLVSVPWHCGVCCLSCAVRVDALRLHKWSPVWSFLAPSFVQQRLHRDDMLTISSFESRWRQLVSVCGCFKGLHLLYLRNLLPPPWRSCRQETQQPGPQR